MLALFGEDSLNQIETRRSRKQRLQANKENLDLKGLCFVSNTTREPDHRSKSAPLAESTLVGNVENDDCAAIRHNKSTRRPHGRKSQRELSKWHTDQQDMTTTEKRRKTRTMTTKQKSKYKYHSGRSRSNKDSIEGRTRSPKRHRMSEHKHQQPKKAASKTRSKREDGGILAVWNVDASSRDGTQRGTESTLVGGLEARRNCRHAEDVNMESTLLGALMTRTVRVRRTKMAVKLDRLFVETQKKPRQKDRRNRLAPENEVAFLNLPSARDFTQAPAKGANRTSEKGGMLVSSERSIRARRRSQRKVLISSLEGKQSEPCNRCVEGCETKVCQHECSEQTNEPLSAGSAEATENSDATEKSVPIILLPDGACKEVDTKECKEMEPQEVETINAVASIEQADNMPKPDIVLCLLRSIEALKHSIQSTNPEAITETVERALQTTRKEIQENHCNEGRPGNNMLQGETDKRVPNTSIAGLDRLEGGEVDQEISSKHPPVLETRELGPRDPTLTIASKSPEANRMAADNFEGTNRPKHGGAGSKVLEIEKVMAAPPIVNFYSELSHSAPSDTTQPEKRQESLPMDGDQTARKGYHHAPSSLFLRKEDHHHGGKPKMEELYFLGGKGRPEKMRQGLVTEQRIAHNQTAELEPTRGAKEGAIDAGGTPREGNESASGGATQHHCGSERKTIQHAERGGGKPQEESLRSARLQSLSNANSHQGTENKATKSIDRASASEPNQRRSGRRRRRTQRYAHEETVTGQSKRPRQVLSVDEVDEGMNSAKTCGQGATVSKSDDGDCDDYGVDDDCKNGDGDDGELLADLKNGKVARKRPAKIQKAGAMARRERSGSTQVGKGAVRKPSVDDWDSDLLACLRKAHSCVDPRSDRFWTEVAELVKGKDAVACSTKWFDAVKTPTAKPPRKKGKARKMDTHGPDGRGDEDDLFDATPMRMATLFEGKDGGLTVDPMSPIGGASDKRQRPATEYDDEQFDREKNPGVAVRQKTYLTELRRGVARAAKNRKRQRAKKAKGRCRGFRETEYGEGGIEVNASMTPGGTLRVKTTLASDAEDDLFGDSDCE